MEHNESPISYKILTGNCPDSQCCSTLFFPSHDVSIECASCGQRHEISSIKNKKNVPDSDLATGIHSFLKNYLLGNVKPRKDPDTIKVLGMSNYTCKLLSPILSRYGMDRVTGNAKLLCDMGQKDYFDCGILGDRAFLIESENLETLGYGRDRSGSQDYLKETMLAIKLVNGNEERLVPIHADGDGHCLVHAVSRAIVGRELFWHSLRENLERHFKDNLETYKFMFRDFIGQDEWIEIINECNPDFISCNGEPVGLRNIHAFGLANVLRRPIILLDSISGMESLGDYSGTFLPALSSPDQCSSKDGVKNKPICIAWSSRGHNHYIPLVAVKGRPLPKLPMVILPQSWGTPSDLRREYIDFDENDYCVIGGSKCLQDRYLFRLVNAMQTVFHDVNRVKASLVSEVHQYIYKASGAVGLKPQVVIESTRRAISEERLYRCLTCEALCEFNLLSSWFQPGGDLYEMARDAYGPLRVNTKYTFPRQGIVCWYNGPKDILVPDKKLSKLLSCVYCHGSNVRLINGDGSVHYENGDHTSTPATASRCSCGFKHFWDGKEYNNIPELLSIQIEVCGRVVTDTVAWFRYESDPELNSNALDVAYKFLSKHFPGEFFNDHQTQTVIDAILEQLSQPSEEPQFNRIPSFNLSSGSNSTTGVLQTSDLSTSVEVPTSMETGDTEKSAPVSEAELEPSVSSETSASTDNTVPGSQGHTSNRLPNNLDITPDANMAVVSNTEVNNLSSTDMIGACRARMRDSLKSMQQKTKIFSSDSSSNQTSSKTEGMITGVSLTPPLQQHVPMEITSHPVAVETESQPLPERPPDCADTKSFLKEKRIRIASCDGHQMVLNLTTNVTFGELQNRIFRELGVPPKRQKLRAGFPPKPLEASVNSTDPIHLEHGDKITLDILPESADDDIDRSADTTSNKDDIEKGYTDVEISVASLTLMAAVARVDLWDYVQNKPHLFTLGGLFCQHVKRKYGLKDGNHYSLTSFPDKVFVYNERNKRLELCQDDHKHRAVGSALSARNRTIKSEQDLSSLNKLLSLLEAEKRKSTSNMFDSMKGDNPAANRTLGHIRSLADKSDNDSSQDSSSASRASDAAKIEIFKGQGHTLRESSKESSLKRHSLDVGMPKKPTNHKTFPQSQSAYSIDTSQSDQRTASSAQYKKLGPGFSVLLPPTSHKKIGINNSDGESSDPDESSC